MDDFMRSILSRVLSEELAQQKLWQQKELEQFGIDPADRNTTISKIQQFMEDNDIEFRQDFYDNRLYR